MVELDELKSWLLAQGFKTDRNGFAHRDDSCHWYAWRKSSLPARDCECNEGKGAQLVIYPHRFCYLGEAAKLSAEVEVVGEVGGLWFKLQVYALSVDELRERLPGIEANLVSAWNALQPNEVANG